MRLKERQQQFRNQKTRCRHIKDSVELRIHSRNGNNTDSVLVHRPRLVSVGPNLTKALLREGYRVTGLDIVPPGSATLLGRDLGPSPILHTSGRASQDIQPWDIEGTRGCRAPGGAA